MSGLLLPPGPSKAQFATAQAQIAALAVGQAVPSLDVSAGVPRTSKTVTLDNGMYDVLIEGPAASEWRRIFVTTGSRTITPPTGDTYFTRARFYGPYKLTPNTGDAVGAALLAGAVFNSRGVTGYGIAPVLGQKATRAFRSPVNVNAHNGWTTDGQYYYIFDTGAIIKRRRDDWSVVAQNNSPFTGLITSGANAPNHLGDGCYYNGRLYVAVGYWAGACGSLNASSQIAVYDAATLALVETHDVMAVTGATGAFSGVGIDAANRIIYACDYCTPQIWRFDLDTFASIGTLAISPTYIQSLQGIAPQGNLLWLSGLRYGGSATTILAVDLTGKPVQELLRTDQGFAGYSDEGIGFDTDGRLGILVDHASTNETYVDFYDIVPPTMQAAGFQGDQKHFVSLAGTQLDGDFTTFAGYVPTTITGTTHLWDAVVAGSITKAWVPSNRQLTARASGAGADSAVYTAGLTAGKAATISYAYTASTKARALYVDGQDRVTGNETTTLTWAANTSMAIGGAHQADTSTEGRFGYFYVFSRALTLTEKQALEADPGRIWAPVSPLSSAQKTLIQAG